MNKESQTKNLEKWSKEQLERINQKAKEYKILLMDEYLEFLSSNTNNLSNVDSHLEYMTRLYLKQER